MQTCRSSRKSLSIFPVPSTTEASGSSAIETGKPVSSRMRLSRFFSSAPPPVRTMPRSLISAESSGGVRSSATRMSFKIVDTHSASDSRISLSSMVTVRGTPSIKLRPFTYMVSGVSSGDAVFHRLDGHYVSRRAPPHILGLAPHRHHFARRFVDCHDRRLVHHDPFAVREHQRVRRSQVDRQVGRKQAEHRPEVVTVLVHFLDPPAEIAAAPLPGVPIVSGPYDQRKGARAVVVP